MANPLLLRDAMPGLTALWIAFVSASALRPFCGGKIVHSMQFRTRLLQFHISIGRLYLEHDEQQILETLTAHNSATDPHGLRRILAIRR
jgi:hypothetical protein